MCEEDMAGRCPVCGRLIEDCICSGEEQNKTEQPACETYPWPEERKGHNGHPY